MPALATIVGRVLLATLQQGYTYLLGPFRFSTDQAAPLTSPYTEPGAVGSLTLAGAARQSTSAGELLVSGDGAAYANTSATSQVFSGRTVGSAAVVRIRPVTGLFRLHFGWAVNTTHQFNRQNNLWSAGSASAAATSPGAVNEDLLIVRRAVGAFYLYKLASTNLWTLVAVENTGASVNQTASIDQFDVATAYYDDLRALNLGAYDARFATDEGLATDRKASSSAGDTITQTADAWVEHTLAAATGVDKDFYVRWTDDNNCWIVRQNQAGSTVKLIEKVAGVETSRMSAGQTFTNGTAYRLIAVCDGATITVWVNTAKSGAYSSATTNQTATTAKAPVAGTELKSYPRTVTLPAGI